MMAPPTSSRKPMGRNCCSIGGPGLEQGWGDHDCGHLTLLATPPNSAPASNATSTVAAQAVSDQRIITANFADAIRRRDIVAANSPATVPSTNSRPKHQAVTIPVVTLSLIHISE